MDERIKRFLNKVRLRVGWQNFLKNEILFLAIFSILTCVISLVSVFVPIYYANLFVGLTLIGAVILALLYSVVTYPTEKEAARMVDALGYDERFVTCVECKNKQGRLYEMQRQDTLEIMQDIDMKSKLPFHVKRVPVVLLCVFLFGTMALGMMESPAKTKAKKHHEWKQEVKKQETELKKLEKQVEKLAEKDTLTKKERTELEKIIKDALNELENTTSKEELEKVSKRTENKLQTAAKESKKEEVAKAVGNAIKNEKLEAEVAFEKKMEELAKENAAVAESLENLKNLSQFMSKEQLEKLASQLENLQKENKLSETELSETLQNMDDANASVVAKAIDQAESQSQNAGESSNKNQNENAGKTGKGSEGESGEENGNKSGEGKGKSGNGNGNGNGSGNGSGSGNGNGGGYDTGTKTGIEKDLELDIKKEKVYIPDKSQFTNDKNLTGKHSGNTSYSSKVEDGLGYEGNTIEYDAVIGSYQKDAQAKIKNGSIPSGMEETVKSYFSGLE